MSLTKVSFSMIQGPIYSVLDYGASTTADAATNSTAISTTILAASNAGGGTVVIPPGTYTVNGGIGGIGGTSKICIFAYGAVLQQHSVNAEYNMFSPSSNMTIMGLSLVGYVASGTDYSNVQPAWSFGFRVDGSQSNVRFIDCNVDNIPYDGWYISGTVKDIYLDNCTGSLTTECYRNTVAVAPSTSGNVTNVIITGSKYGAAHGRPAIDLEPDGGGVLGYVFIGQGTHVIGGVDVIAGIRHVEIDGMTFDSVNSYLQCYFCSKLQLSNLDFINGAVLRSIGYNQGTSGSPTSNVDSTDLEVGKISGLSNYGDAFIGPNVILGSYNTLANWSQYLSPGTSPSLTITPNKNGVGPTEAILIDATNYAATYTQTVQVVSGNYYTFGGYMITETGNCTIVFTEKNSGGSVLTYKTYRGNAESGKFAAILKLDPATTQVDISWGSQTTSGANKAYFGALFLRRGVVTDWTPSQNETIGPVWEAAPTTGTWAQGNTVIDNTPSSGGNLGWVCTTAGTPGTWKTFGTIS